MSDNPAPIPDLDPDLQSFDTGLDPLDGQTEPIEPQKPLDAINDGDFHLGGGSAEDGKVDKRDANLSAQMLDDVGYVLALPDPQAFFGGLVGALSRLQDPQVAQSTDLVRRILAVGIAQECDEELIFDDLINILIRKSFSAEALKAPLPIMAAFLARIASEPIRASRSEPAKSNELTRLVRSAAQILVDILENQGSRGWRKLPNIAASIAARAAQQRLSIGDLAEALPRLSGRQKADPLNVSASAAERRTARSQSRRIVLNGPVEIVILGR